ncbi:MAG TPA: chemotaxis protein CheW, partial [Pseudobdellovibrionaceae bacterium]|nr:chemotaxis protein CheW [Pseudobdellovibrionaceae bacterium]
LYPIIPLSKVLFAKDTTLERDEFLIILVETSHGKKYGVAVESLIDFEDAVVKPVEKVIKNLNVYTGATFLSNGMVGLLLDIDGIAHHSKITEFSRDNESENTNVDYSQQSSVALNYLVFELDSPGAFAVRQDQLFRLEEFTDNELTQIGGQTLKEYRGKTMTFFDLSALFLRGIGEAPKLAQRTEENKLMDSNRNPTFVMYQNDHYYGFSVNRILDIVSTDGDIHPPIQAKPGLIGSTVVNGKMIAIIDPIVMIEYAESFSQENTIPNAA